MWFSKIFKKVYYKFCYSFLQSKMIYYTFQYSGERSKTHRFHNKSANAHRGDTSVKTSESNTQGFMHRKPPLRFLCSVCRASRDKFNITLSGAQSLWHVVGSCTRWFLWILQLSRRHECTIVLVFTTILLIFQSRTHWHTTVCRGFSLSFLSTN